jgi:hypothetical protein
VVGPFDAYTLEVVNEAGDPAPFQDKKKKDAEARAEAGVQHLHLYHGSPPLVIIQPGAETREILRGIEDYYTLQPGVTYSITARRSILGTDGKASEIVSNTIKIRIAN